MAIKRGTVEPHNQMQFIVLTRTPFLLDVIVVLILRGDTVSIFIKPINRVESRV